MLGSLKHCLRGAQIAPFRAAAAHGQNMKEFIRKHTPTPIWNALKSARINTLKSAKRLEEVKELAKKLMLDAVDSMRGLPPRRMRYVGPGDFQREGHKLLAYLKTQVLNLITVC